VTKALALLLFLLLPGTAALAASPADAIRDFYAALERGDCDVALALRPGYSRARCTSMRSARLQEVETICSTPNTAALHLEVVYTTSDAPSRERRFSGHATVTLEADGWRIVSNSFHRDATTARSDYLRDVAGIDPGCVDAGPAATAPAASAAAGPGPQSLEELQRAAAEALAALQGGQAAPQPQTTEQEPAQPAAQQGAHDSPPQEPSAPQAEKSESEAQGAETAPSPQAEVLQPPPGMASVRQRVEGDWYVPPLESGSLAILRGAFGPAALEGISSEARITPLPEPDRFPPVRQESGRRLAPVSGEYRGMLNSVAPAIEIKPVALTFNLGERLEERSGYDAAIVEFLRAHAVPATFYASGKWLRSHDRRAMQLMADPLFELGSLGWSQAPLQGLSRLRLRNQLLWPQGQFEQLWEELEAMAVKQGAPPEAMRMVPALPLTLRLPYGHCSEQALEIAAAQGLPVIKWDVDSGDLDPEATALGVAAQIRTQARPGSIILMHANGRGRRTAESLPLFVPWLREQGYHFVTVSQLLQLGSPRRSEGCGQ